jgi:site-specific DNA recombinase
MTVARSAAIYARISQTKEDRDKVADQIAQCRRLAKSRGYEVVAVFQDDGISAMGDNERPGYEALLDALLRGDFDIILATEEERLARNVPEKAELQAACMEMGATWETVRDGAVDPSTETGEFFSTMRAAMGRMESRRKAARQRAANAEKIADGLPSAGKRRFGFKPRNIEAEPEEAAKVLDLFEQVKAGVPTYRLAKELGKDVVTLRGILTNPAYAGWVVKGVYEKKRLVRRDRFEAHPSVARIVPRELWEEVQAVLADSTRKTSPGGQPLYPASGLVFCGVCNGPMHSRSENYLCTADLSHPCIKKETLDEVLLWEVFSYLANSDDSEGTDILELRNALAAAEGKRAKAQELYLMDGVDQAAVSREIAKLGKTIKETSEKLKTLRAERVAADVVAEIRDALPSDMTDEQGAAWWEGYWTTLPLETQRALVSCLNVTVENGRTIDRVKVSWR